MNHAPPMILGGYFTGGAAVIVYDYGAGIVGEDTHGIKLRIIPAEWFST